MFIKQYIVCVIIRCVLFFFLHNVLAGWYTTRSRFTHQNTQTPKTLGRIKVVSLTHHCCVDVVHVRVYHVVQSTETRDNLSEHA